MLDCLKQTRVSVGDMELLDVPNMDDIDVKSEQVLPNGWHAQPYVDLLSLEIFGRALEHAESGQAVVPLLTRTQVGMYILNQAKVSTRIKMMLRGVTKVGSTGCNSKKIADVISMVKKLMESASKLGDEYVQTAEDLCQAVSDMFEQSVSGGDDPSQWNEIYDALCDVLEMHTDAIQELADACQGLQGGQTESNDKKKILAAGTSVGQNMLMVTEMLLVAINDERRIAFCNLEWLTKSLGTAFVDIVDG